MLTLAHELTHIWQYQNWDNTQIATQYGEEKTEVYEGMAAWVEVQYAYLINESIGARRKNDDLLARDDVYGKGFRRYSQKYPISEDTMLQGTTPFMDKNNPL